VPAGEEPLLDALERWARATTGVVVPRDAWDWDRVEPHLRPTYRVLDDQGQEQARGKDLDELKAPLRPRFEQAMAEVAADSGLARTGVTSWVFGTIEQRLTRTRAGHEVTAHPCLDDEGTTVGLVVAGSETEQEARHRLGVRRLVLLALPSGARLVDGLSNADKLGLAGSPYPSVAALVDDCRAAVVIDAVDARPPVLTEADLDALVADVRRTLDDDTREVLGWVLRILDEWRAADKALSGRADMAMLPALADMKAQLARLVHGSARGGFVGEAGAARLRRYPTYLQALRRRRAALDEGGSAVNRDRALMDRTTDLQDAWAHQLAALPAGRPPEKRLREVRWMLEEYRVSLWAQQLGTAGPVSDQRIRKALG